MIDPVVIATVAALAIPSGKEWIDHKEVECTARIVWHEARNRHIDAQVAIAYSALDRAALAGTSVCATIKKGTYPWAGRKRFGDQVAWERAAEIATLVYAGELDRRCPGNPTHFDRWTHTGWPVWKSTYKMECWLDGIAFWSKR